MSEGYFITLEGIDGAGKTTVADVLEDAFDEVVRTSEPSQHDTGKFVRELLQDESSNPLVDFHAFMADRKKHIEETIKPALDDGKIVVSDRYADSTRAYQTELLRSELVNPARYIRRTMDPWSLPPDLTIYLDIPPEVSMERVNSGEKYEEEELLDKVHRNYTLLGNRFDDRWVTVNGTQAEEDVVQEVLDLLDGTQ